MSQLPVIVAALPIGDENKIKGAIISVFGLVVAAAAIGIAAAGKRRETHEIARHVSHLGIAAVVLAVSGAIVAIGVALASGGGLPTAP